MRRSLALLLVPLALVVAGCGGSARRDGRVVVPHLSGKGLRSATCELQRLGLRWRYRGGRQVIARNRECGDSHIGSSMDDIPVTGQSRRPGALVRRGAVIVIDDACTDLARRGGGGCA